MMPSLAGWLLHLAGWRIEGWLPPLPKFVLIVAPHTSNWDFWIALLAMFILDLRASWLGKHTLFRFPAGPILRWFGGEAIDRSASHGTVEAAIERFRSRPQWVIAIAPEGTRKLAARWKTGFHRIALGADVPIVPVWIDYPNRVLGIGVPVPADQDEETGVARVQALFRREMARFPDRFAVEGQGGSGAVSENCVNGEREAD